MKGRIWTVPNQITLLRLGFLPYFLILISYEQYKWALLVQVLAGLSDGIDGLLARSLNQRSALGAYLDPIADKLLLSSSFIILAFKQKLAWWLTILVLSRDIPESLGWIVKPIIRRVAKASLIGTLQQTRTAVLNSALPGRAVATTR